VETGPRPSDIERVVELKERAFRSEARREAMSRGLDGEALARAVERRVQQWRQEPRVTADASPSEDGTFARFWARLYLCDSHWRVSGTLAEGQYGGVVVRELSIRPWADSQLEPSANVLRSLSLATLKDRALRELRTRAEFVRQFADLERETGGRARLTTTAAGRKKILRAAEQAGPPTPRRGVKGGGEDFYRGVTRDAIEIARVGLPVYETLAAERHAKPETARKWIAKARRDGFLHPGRNVWQPGPNYPKAKEET
jgi:hypothetical protein